ncbi:MAG: hypothetical protein H6560_04095 [Lewinellaceae bacterium]|nr:hypothetical protein [Lewinellaceae bacterium]
MYFTSKSCNLPSGTFGIDKELSVFLKKREVNPLLVKEALLKLPSTVSSVASCMVRYRGENPASLYMLPRGSFALYVADVLLFYFFPGAFSSEGTILQEGNDVAQHTQRKNEENDGRTAL